MSTYVNLECRCMLLQSMKDMKCWKPILIQNKKKMLRTMVVSEKTGNIKGMVLHFLSKWPTAIIPIVVWVDTSSLIISVYFEQITFVLRNGCGKWSTSAWIPLWLSSCPLQHLGTEDNQQSATKFDVCRFLAVQPVFLHWISVRQLNNYYTFKWNATIF